MLQGDAPGWLIDAEQAGQIAFAKATLDAHARVVAADVIDTSEPCEGQLAQVQVAARGLAKNEQTRMFAPLAAEVDEQVVLKLMQDKVAEDHVVVGILGVGAQILA